MKATAKMSGPSVKVALVHANIIWKDKERNLERLLSLNQEAACQGARIILNPELSISGYAFGSRRDIEPTAETIPGPVTRQFGVIAKQHRCYIAVTLPEIDPAKRIIYNSAAIIGPDGEVIGKYRKLSPCFRENLWTTPGNMPVLVVDSEFGRFGLVICSDGYSYKPVRIAALKGADFVLLPVNWPADYNNPEIYWRARALENGIHMLVCNRTGHEDGMDFRSGESFIIDERGKIIGSLQSEGEGILYGELPVRQNGSLSARKSILRQRRPMSYGQLSLAPYANLFPEVVLELPAAREITSGVVQFSPLIGQSEHNLSRIMDLIDKSLDMASQTGQNLDVLVFPELATTGIPSSPEQAREWGETIPGPATAQIASIAEQCNIHIILGMLEIDQGRLFNSSVLIGPKGVMGKYRKVHLASHDKVWAEAGDEFPFFDLPFARLGMLVGRDLMFPEASECLAKMGVDLLCAPSFWDDPRSLFLWEARGAEQMHLLIANQGNENRAVGQSAIINYHLDSDHRCKTTLPAQQDDIQLVRLNIGDARMKRFLENVDYDILLDQQGDVPLLGSDELYCDIITDEQQNE